MANIKSQKKRIRTNEKAAIRNKAVRTELKTRIKNAIKASSDGNAKESAESLKIAIRQLDQAAAKGIIHKNQAANRKSGLMRRLNSLAS